MLNQLYIQDYNELYQEIYKMKEFDCGKFWEDMGRDPDETIRVFSGINGYFFNQGYDKETKIFDKTKTDMHDKDYIHCFSEDYGLSLTSLEQILELGMEEYMRNPGFFKLGKKLVISGEVKRRNMGYGNFANVIYPKLKIDKIYELKGNWVRKKG